MSDTERINRVKLLTMGWIRLFVEDKIGDIPVEIKLVCNAFLGALIDSKIMTMDEEELLLKFIKEQTKRDNWNWTLLYRATEHGFEKDAFYQKCRDKGNTVIMVENSLKNQVFGGYTPCEWKYDNDRAKDASGATFGPDPTLTSFLFMLRSSDSISYEPRVFKLKKDKKDKAVSYRNNTAFDFGCNDWYYYLKEMEFYRMNCCYEWYDDYDITWNWNKDYSHPNEIEIYQLQ